MDFINTISALRVLFDCMIKGKTDFSQISHTPSKTRLLFPDKGPFLPKSTPARTGVDGERLLAFARDVSNDPQSTVHAVTVLAKGKCIFEAAKEGYSTKMPHATFSLCKTLTGLAVGMLVDDGRLSPADSVVSFFPELSSKRLGQKTRALKISHLLSMSVDMRFNEAGVVASENYTKSYFESAVRGTPGEGFAYNSMHSYILAAIVTRISGKPLSEFLDERLFAPMGITNYFWESSAEGIEKGGWGLYLSVRSMAKLGQLFLNRGLWQGRRIISEAWLDEMTKRQSSVPSEVGVFDYGYHLWRHKNGESFLLNGMLGQNVWVVPGEQLVVAITAEDHCLFQDSIALLSAMRHLQKMSPRDTLAAKRERRRIARSFGELGSFTPAYISLESKEAEARLFPRLLGCFTTSENNSGVLPLITRLVQNSPTKGIHEVSVAKGPLKNTLLFSFKEREITYRIVAGNCRFLGSALTVYGEKYELGAAYSLGLDEARLPFLRLELRFSSLACSRRFLFRAAERGVTLSLSERPGIRFVEALLRTAPAEGGDLFETLTKTKAPMQWMLKRVRQVFSPTLRLTPKDPRGQRRKQGEKSV